MLPLIFLAGMAVLLGTSTWLDTQVREKVFFARFEQEVMETQQATLRTLVDLEAQRLGRIVQDIPATTEKIAIIERETDLPRFFPDKSGYFFTYQLDGTRISVPINKSLNGKNTLDAVDSSGKRYIEELIVRAREGGGFVRYLFEKPGAGVQPKLSYAARIPGTEFMVGAGVYIDNVEAEVQTMRGDVSVLVRRYRIILLVLSAIIASLTLGASLLLARRLATSVRDAIQGIDRIAFDVDLVAGQMAESSARMATGVSEQAASLEETGASLEQMSGMTRRNAESATEVTGIGREARSAAEQGARDMEAMNRSMDAILASSQGIGKILKSIDEIAFQTNILALNAAVEAARAGESGLGFAVVAEEVRSLAQRSAQAARDTATKIETAVTTTTEGVDLSRKVTLSLERILEQIRRVDGLTEGVATASREQTTGIEQVNQAIHQINQVTQHASSTAEECASAAQELRSHSSRLKNAATSLSHLAR